MFMTLKIKKENARSRFNLHETGDKKMHDSMLCYDAVNNIAYVVTMANQTNYVDGPGDDGCFTRLYKIFNFLCHCDNLNWLVPIL